MFEIDEEMIRAMQSTKFVTTFNIMLKLAEYSQKPNTNIEARENVMVFQKWDDQQFMMEDYRLIPLYGCTGMQFLNTPEKLVLNLKSFPDGTANWDRSVLMTFVKGLEDYTVITTIATSGGLTDMDQVFFSKTKNIDLSFIRSVLFSVKDEIPNNCYALFEDHLNALETVFERDMGFQQLKLEVFSQESN